MLPAGRKTRLRAWQLLMRSVKSAFALLLTKVTKHIPPQTSPVGLSLAGIWSTLGSYLCQTLYYNLYNKASGNVLLERERWFEHEGCITVCEIKEDFALQYVRQLENEKHVCMIG